MSVTVVAPNGLTTDPLTKVPAVLGPQKGLALLEKLDGVAVRMVVATDKGLEVVASKRFVELPRKKE
jgi:thiamine biosynthesis lipoprotein ApbE